MIIYEKMVWIKIIVGVYKNIIDKGGEKNFWEILVNYIVYFIIRGLKKKGIKFVFLNELKNYNRFFGRVFN